MGITLLLLAWTFTFHAGICWEKRKNTKLTRRDLMFASVIGSAFGGYFMLAAIGHYAKYL